MLSSEGKEAERKTEVFKEPGFAQSISIKVTKIAQVAFKKSTFSYCTSGY